LKHIVTILLAAVIASITYTWASEIPMLDAANRTVRRVQIYPDFVISVRQPPNGLMRIYDLSGATTDAGENPILFARPLDKKAEAYVRGTPRQQILLQELLTIPGVDSATLEEHCITVERAFAFDWDQIEPVTIERIRARLFDYDTKLFIPPREARRLKILVRPAGQNCAFHLNREISESTAMFEPNDSRSEAFDRIGPIGVAVVCAVLELPGVQSIYVSPYSISVALEGNWTPALVKEARVKLRQAITPLHPSPPKRTRPGRLSHKADRAVAVS